MDEVWKKQWELALDGYGDMVYRLALARMGHKEDAEDAAQTVFLRYAESLKKGMRFESQDHEKAWLLRVTINQTKKHFGSAWIRHRAELTTELTFSEPGLAEVYMAVQALPDKYRTVIHLFYYEGYSVKEMADLLGRKENTVKSLLKRGRDKLRVQLKES